MKTLPALIVKEDGLIYAADVPERPKFISQFKKGDQTEQRFTIEDMRECWDASRDHEFYKCDPAQKNHYPNFNEWIKTYNPPKS